MLDLILISQLAIIFDRLLRHEKLLYFIILLSGLTRWIEEMGIALNSCS